MRTANLAAGNNPGNSVSFNNLPSGTYTLTAGAGARLNISAFTSREITVDPKVTLTLAAAAGGEATVTARITDGTIGTPVTIRAIIDGPGVGSDNVRLPELSGSSGQVTHTFTGLTPGSWMLSGSSSAAPAGIVLLNIPSATASADVAEPKLREASVTWALSGGDLTATVAITDGTRLANSVRVTLELSDGTARFATLPKDTVNPSASTTFRNLAPGSYTLTASAPGFDITVSPPTFEVIDVDTDNDGLIEINFLEDLDYVRHNLAGTSYKPGASAVASTTGAPAGGLKGYELVRDLDFDEATSYRSGSVNAAWTNGAGPNTGWTPIGDNSTNDDTTRFSAIFDGNGHTIRDLRIARNITHVGLFGRIGDSGRVRNLALNNARVSYTGSSGASVGTLVGLSNGTIVAVSATGGSVDGGDGRFDEVGGLVGSNRSGSTITASYASGAVDGGDGGDIVGGLVGNNGGTDHGQLCQRCGRWRRWY